MIKNMTIGARLVLGFLIVLLLIVLVGMFAIFQMNRLTNVTTKLHDHPLVVSNAVRDVNTNVIAMHRSMKDVALAEDAGSLEAAVRAVEMHEKEVYALFALIKERFLGDRQDVDEAIQIFTDWKAIRSEVIELMRRGEESQAAEITKGKGQQHITILHREIQDLIDFANQKADDFLENAYSEASNARVLMMLLFILSVVIGLSIAMITSRTITHPLREAVHVAEQVSEGRLNVTFDVNSRDEVGQLLRAMKKMIDYIQDVADVAEKVSKKDLHVVVSPKSTLDILNHSLAQMVENLQRMMEENEASMAEIERKNNSMQERNWIKDGISKLGNELAGDRSLIEVSQEAVSFVARYISAGSGALYVYDAEQERLKLYGTFALTERDALSNLYHLGEGVVGQVALERSPILLKHPSPEDRLIATGTTSHAPLQTYTLPLEYDNALYGILELALSEPFGDTTQQFLCEADRVIATALFTTSQRDKVRELLAVSQQARQNAEQAAAEAEQAKEDAQMKAQEIQQANSVLEEQQQKLQQQSEELQQVNAHLEEQQQQLQQQSEELRQQNEHLNKTKEELDVRARELELSSKYKSEFLANMSHELRTPLNSIILLSKMLSRNEQENLSEKNIKQVSVIYQAGEELLRLINDILDLSKIEAGKVTMHVREFSTNDLFETFHDLFRTVAEEKDLEFVVEDELHMTMTTDRDKLSQVIRNLLANAFKFTKEGSVSLRSSLVPGHEELVQFFVSDTGIGIPQEKQQVVFEAFQQADGSTSREFGGTGLGLSIAREYIKLLQGAIHLESQEGCGATFRITLPKVFERAPASKSLETEKAVSFPPQIAHFQPLAATAPEDIVDDREMITSSDKVILVIEDNPDVAQTTMEVTRGMGFKVLVAFNGREGIELTAQYRPHGILLDLVLPGMNGMEVLRELKSTRELRHIPVHIMSSKERDNSFRYSGAIGYFQKPVNDIDIQQAVENLIAISEKYPKRLLIVEDDATQREALQSFLADNGDVEAVSVASQHDAIVEIQQGDYDAAIIDLSLKDGSGYDICRYIKDQDVMLPVIIYTGRELTEEEVRELREYTDSIILKTARSYERLSDETALFLHRTYHGEPEQPSNPSPTPRSIIEENSLDGKKVLIVDDDVKNVFVLASALENQGATVIDAKNGEVALEKLRQEHDVDLVLMDVMMPIMDGYTAMRRIRQDEYLKHLPVIALTAKALKGDRQKCIQAGADDYLSKPVDYDGLIRVVKAWIDRG